ncbi:MAG: phage holin family protein [Ferruginibacter sp.]
MDKAFAQVEELIDSLKEYVNNQIEIVKLKTAAKGSSIFANIVAAIVAAVFIFIFIIIASIALSIYLGQWLGDAWLGYLIVSGIHLLTGIIVWKVRDKLIRIPVMNAIIKEMFHLKKDDEKD